MAVEALNGTPIALVMPKQLHSNVNFDRVGAENIKPESLNSGLIINHRDSSHESDKNGNLNTPILADAPNFYKHNGTSVENSGYFIIPRIVTTDPRYQSARLKYQKVLHILFENAAYAATTYAIATEVIKIQIGQFCVSERQLVELCNQGVRFKDDLVDKNIVHRAVHFWRTCGFVNQQVIHEKNLITITVPEFYKRQKTQSEPPSEPQPNHNRTSKEEDKEDKECINSTMSDSQARPTKVPERIFFDWQEMKLKGIEPSDIESWKSTFTHVDVPEYLKFIEQDMGAKPTKYKKRKQIIKTVLIYFQNKNENNARYQKTAKQPFQKPESHHNKSFNKDTSPKKYNNTYDFSKPQESKP